MGFRRMRHIKPTEMLPLADTHTWLDASDQSSMRDAVSGGNPTANNSLVARWVNRSYILNSAGGAAYTNQTSSYRPARVANVQGNGLDAVEFGTGFTPSVLNTQWDSGYYYVSPYNGKGATLVVVSKRNNTTASIYARTAWGTYQYNDYNGFTHNVLGMGEAYDYNNKNFGVASQCFNYLNPGPAIISILDNGPDNAGTAAQVFSTTVRHSNTNGPFHHTNQNGKWQQTATNGWQPSDNSHTSAIAYVGGANFSETDSVGYWEGHIHEVCMFDRTILEYPLRRFDQSRLRKWRIKGA